MEMDCFIFETTGVKIVHGETACFVNSVYSARFKVKLMEAKCALH